ncbi:hypothetical protein [Neptunomonas phycophila]|uniref:hypothetical protein n=1 Tax=Neptunomonas phycophila TaxID=1572645 RepID=UPI0009490401|nr:hypothetical protein [Neptunomonas phycophila]
MKTSLVPTNLDTLVGDHISTLCPHSIGKRDKDNHCAHFVSHIMGYNVGVANCKNYTWSDKQLDTTGVTIRVDDLFNSSLSNLKGDWANKPKSLTECLIYVTRESNITRNATSIRMGSNSVKHVGVFTNGKVYHYGNTKEEITCDLPEKFISKFTQSYGGNSKKVSFFYSWFL